jgi:hypothetical protein
MRAHRVLGFLLFGGSVWAQQYVISTIAGGAAPPTPTTAVKASIGDPTRVAVEWTETARPAAIPHTEM